jgi:hypothetical protein
VAEAHALGYAVELARGLPADADGEIDYRRREIRMRVASGRRNVARCSRTSVRSARSLIQFRVTTHLTLAA